MKRVALGIVLQLGLLGMLLSAGVIELDEKIRYQYKALPALSLLLYINSHLVHSIEKIDSWGMFLFHMLNFAVCFEAVLVLPLLSKLVISATIVQAFTFTIKFSFANKL